MSKRFTTMPKGEARPLGTPHVKSSKKARVSNEKVVDTNSNVDVDLSQMNSASDALSNESNAAMMPPSSHNSTQKESKNMDITLTRDSKPRKSTSIVFNSPAIRGGVRIAKTAFVNGDAPATLTVSSDSFAQPKPKETKEERKARLKALPKLTLAEKIAKREKALEALKAKAAAAAPAEAATV